MEYVKTIVLLLIGFVLLVKCSDLFVDAVSSLANNFKLYIIQISALRPSVFKISKDTNKK